MTLPSRSTMLPSEFVTAIAPTTPGPRRTRGWPTDAALHPGRAGDDRADDRAPVPTPDRAALEASAAASQAAYPSSAVGARGVADGEVVDDRGRYLRDRVEPVTRVGDPLLDPRA
jgi:hypothetical protein